MSWEDTFRTWGQAPSKTEQQKMENAEKAIRNAIRQDSTLSNLDISVFPQGSYKSRTNVRQDSDVDICVRLNNPFFDTYPAGKSKEDYNNRDGDIDYSEYKNMVGRALNKYFGPEVTRDNKAFKVRSNTYRVDVDVLAGFAHRFYYGDTDEDYIKPTGVGFVTDGGKKIFNWPEQTYENSLDKQKRTGERYRKIVRIIKKLRNKMQEDGVSEANNVPSFLIESLVWNVSDVSFNNENYTDDVRYVIATCFNSTLRYEDYEKMREVNGIKNLFAPNQPWNANQANTFLDKTWDYVGYK